MIDQLHLLGQAAHAAMVHLAPDPTPSAPNIDPGKVVENARSLVGWWIVPALGVIVGLSVIGKSRRGAMNEAVTNTSIFGLGVFIIVASVLVFALFSGVSKALFGA